MAKHVNATKNVLLAAFSSLINIAIGFFAQRIFLGILNAEYLGLNGLFSNIISMLAIFELGIGSAITFSLYKPLVKNDKKTIKALMGFYKRAYNIIAIIVAVAGFSIIPLLPFLIKEVTIDVNITIIYMMFLMDVVFSYILSYRRSILYADQKNYQISLVHIGYLVVMNTLQLTVLALTHNYYLYLGTKIAMRVVENLVIHSIVKKQYPYLNNIKDSKLDKKLEKDIVKKVKSLFFHKIGSFIVLGSDNVIISKFIGLVEVGLYSNYHLIISAIQQLIGQAIGALTPTIGHKLITEQADKTYNIFQKTRFASFCLACIVSVLYMMCMQPFVEIWLGKQYTLDAIVLILLSLNLFQTLQRYAYSTFKEAAGIYYEDRFVPILESIINIIASIILLNFFGLAGVFMGTIVSSIVLWCYSYPRFVYKGIFKRSYLQYSIETAGFLVIFAVCAGLSYIFGSFIQIDNIVFKIIINAIISGTTCIIVISTVLHNTVGFKYFVNKIKKIANK